MGFSKCVSNFHTKTNVSGFKCLWGMNELVDLDYACIFFWDLGKLVLIGRDKHFAGLCHFFGLKFLTALKVGASACMLDGGADPVRRGQFGGLCRDIGF